MRTLSCAIAAALTLATSAALANSGGVPGYTGKPTAIAPQGESCNQCHSGGAAPAIALEGPASLQAGQSAEYQLIVTTTLGKAGGGVAATDGVVLTPVANVRDSFGEMVQTGAITVAQGKATFRFKVTAPATGTSLKLWAVGLAANGGNGNNGDKATHTTREIAITGGMPAPAPTPDAGTDSGSASTPSNNPPGGSTSGGTGTGTSGSADPNAPPTADDDADPTNGSTGQSRPSRPRTLDDEAGGCAASSGTISGSGIFVLGVVCIIGFAARRRKRLLRYSRR